MPDRAVKEIVGHSEDWTAPAVLAALARISALPSPPGTAHLYSNTGYICLYSNTGYICLAVAVERAEPASRLPSSPGSGASARSERAPDRRYVARS